MQIKKGIVKFFHDPLKKQKRIAGFGLPTILE
jgi:hypothetical protein